MRSSTIAITVLCLMSVTVSPISESWRCRARLRIPPRERRRLSSAYAQSLGELAKKEKERRKKVTDESKVVTNDDLSRFKNAPVATGVLPPRSAEQKPAKQMTGVEAKSAAAGAAKENPDEPVDLQGRPESFWRQTLGEARQRVTELENEHAVLVLRINELRRRFFSTDDGFRRQAVQWELQKTVIQRASTRKRWRRQRHDSKSWKRKLAEAALFRDGSLRKLRNS